jgi:alkanesulfonate monooxygenase SsuD/methylene tetrahydromethanopterin reductase-like flavin-dependent oxidoreductase (luciferase family)
MPYEGDGRSVAGPVLEGWTVLTAVAARTTRIRLGTLVLGASYRHPAVVAKMAATLDHVSDGRLTLGLGAGWQPNEHTAYGIELLPAPARLARFAEYVAAVRSLLREPGTTVAGEWFRLTDATCDPPPVQQPLPLLVGGGGERRTMRVAALHADAWHTWATPAELARKNAVLDQHCVEVGRDTAAIARVTGGVLEADEPAGAVRARLAACAAAGADEFVLRDHRAQALPDALRAVDRLLSAAQAAPG